MAIIFISPGVLTDAGGIIIVRGADGKIHIKRVPGWDPEVLHEVTAAAVVFAHAGQIKDAKVRTQLEHAAQAVVERRSAEINEYLSAEH